LTLFFSSLFLKDRPVLDWIAAAYSNKNQLSLVFSESLEKKSAGDI